MTVDFYTLPDGVKPVQEFLDALPVKLSTKTVRVIALLHAQGISIRAPYSKHLSDGIFELRANLATDEARVLYFFLVGDKAVLTHGFVKKTGKTPPEEIERAKKYRAEYLGRKERK
ncbi:toxin RelE [Clostridia bacterium]|nr:toxin RelE [Clostridia bacterium]